MSSSSKKRQKPNTKPSNKIKFLKIFFIMISFALCLAVFYYTYKFKISSKDLKINDIPLIKKPVHTTVVADQIKDYVMQHSDKMIYKQINAKPSKKRNIGRTAKPVQKKNSNNIFSILQKKSKIKHDVQVGHFKRHKSAQKEQKRISKIVQKIENGHAISIEKQNTDGNNTEYALKIRGFGSLQKAKSFCSKLRDVKQGCFVVRGK